MAITTSLIGGEGYVARVLRDGAVGYWRLNGNPNDSAPVPHNGVVNGAPTFGQAGPLSTGATAALFNGSPDYIVIGTTEIALAVGDVATLELWIKIATWPGSLSFLFGSGTTSGAGGLACFLNSAGRIAVQTIGVTAIVTSTASVPADSAWHHVVWSKNAATNKLYIDGVDVTGTVTNGTHTATASAIFIGAQNGSSLFTVGRLAECAVYATVALTAEQVKAHYGLRLVTGPGGLQVSGTAPAARSVAIASTGGVRVSGTAPAIRQVGLVSSGGLRLSGTAPVTRLVGLVATGGLALSGTAPATRRVTLLSTGGLRLSGAALIATQLTNRIALVGTGGWRMSGAAVVTTTRGRSFSALPAVSRAIYAALNVPIVTDRAPGGVHDVVPQNTPYPFVLFEVSEARQLGGFGTKPGNGELPEINLRVHVYSQQTNLSEAQALLARAISCLTDPPRVVGYGSWAIFHDATIDLGDQVIANITAHELVAICRLYVEENPVYGVGAFQPTAFQTAAFQVGA